MSVIGGEECHDLQVISNVIVFRFKSYKLFGVLCLWIEVPKL